MEEIQQKKVAMISPDGKKSFVPLTEFMSKVRYANLANVKIRDLEITATTTLLIKSTPRARLLPIWRTRPTMKCSCGR